MPHRPPHISGMLVHGPQTSTQTCTDSVHSLPAQDHSTSDGTNAGSGHKRSVCKRKRKRVCCVGQTQTDQKCHFLYSLRSIHFTRCDFIPTTSTFCHTEGFPIPEKNSMTGVPLLSSGAPKVWGTATASGLLPRRIPSWMKP